MSITPSNKFLICGFMGAGKSWLIDELKKDNEISDSYRVLDLDQEIARLDNSLDVNEVIAIKGWEWFRESEFQTLQNLIAEDGPLILSLGGGSLERGPSLKGSTLCWLKTDFETCWKRIEESHRPKKKMGREALKDLYEKRALQYKQAEHSFYTLEQFVQILKICKN